MECPTCLCSGKEELDMPRKGGLGHTVLLAAGKTYIAGNCFCKAWAFLLQAMLFAFEHHQKPSPVCELMAQRQSERSRCHVKNHFAKAGVKLDYMYWLKNIISFLHTPLAIAKQVLFSYTGETWLWNINTTSGSHENIWGEHHALLSLFIESPLVHHSGIRGRITELWSNPVGPLFCQNWVALTWGHQKVAKSFPR